MWPRFSYYLPINGFFYERNDIRGNKVDDYCRSRDNAYINVSFSSEFVSPIKTKMRVNLVC